MGAQYKPIAELPVIDPQQGVAEYVASSDQPASRNSTARLQHTLQPFPQAKGPTPKIMGELAVRHGQKNVGPPMPPRNWVGEPYIDTHAAYYSAALRGRQVIR